MDMKIILDGLKTKY